MTEQTSKLAGFYVGFNGVLRGVSRVGFPIVEYSVNHVGTDAANLELVTLR